MKKTIGLLIVLATCCCLTSYGQTKTGTTGDFVDWNKAAIQFSRIDSSRFSAGAELSYRRIDNAQTAQLFLGLAFVKYSFPRAKLDIIGTYALVHFYNFLGNVDLYQLGVGRSLGTPRTRLRAYVKLATDRIFFPIDRQLNRWRYRAYVGAGCPVAKGLSIRAANEFLLTSLPGLTTSENRAQAGLYVRIGRTMEFGASYLNRWVQGNPAPNLVEHTLLTEYIINL